MIENKIAFSRCDFFFFNSCCIWNQLEFDLIDWSSYLFYVRFTKIWLLFDWRWCVWLWFLNLIRLSTAQRTISVSFTSLLVRCTGKRLGAFFLKTVLFVRKSFALFISFFTCWQYLTRVLKPTFVKNGAKCVFLLPFFVYLLLKHKKRKGKTRLKKKHLYKLKSKSSFLIILRLLWYIVLILGEDWSSGFKTHWVHYQIYH